MKSNKSLASAIALSAFTLFASSDAAFAQTSTTTFKKGTPEAVAELKSSQALALNVDAADKGKGERGAKRLEQLQSRLNLTAEQTTKIKAILETARNEAKAEREKAGENKEAFRSSMKDRMQKTDAQIQTVLNADQKLKYAEIKAEMKEKRQERREKMKDHKGRKNQQRKDNIKD